ncbi:MAG: hypothetical protein ACT4P3_16575 [Betaproteobacteria bacterium]
MSAAATAAGYLYASGRLRGRGAKGPEQQEQQPRQEPQRAHKQPAAPEQREVRVAVYEPQAKPRRVPKIAYRTRRWRPGGESR